MIELKYENMYISTGLGSLIGKFDYGKFQDFSATQFLRDINSGHFEAPKTAILTI